VSQLTHLKAASRRVVVPELDYPEPDESIAYITDYFYRLRESCKGKISFLELQAFSQLMRLDLCAWECDMIMQLDSILESSLNG
jgi:hypothetical protein